MAKAKRPIHFTTGPNEKAVGVFGWYSLCGFVQRWSHNGSRTWDLLTEDPNAVTCVHCRRDQRRKQDA